MLTPQTLDKLPDELVGLIDELQTDIIKSIAKKITKADYLTPSAEWQLYKAEQLRMSTSEVNALLAKYTGKSKREIRRLYTDACKQAINEDAKIYRAYGKDASSFTRSVAFSNALKAGIANADGMMSNFTKSMVQSSRKTVTHLMDKAYLQVLSGAFSPQEAICSAVAELAAKGIQSVTYPSGRTDWADVAIRRAVITGVGQTTGKMQLDLAKEMDCDLVEVTSHMGARPNHAEWQGRVYSISGSSEKYPMLADATGYGTGEGLKGWNCRHDFYPFFEGISERASLPIDKEENAKEYELSQKQRTMERAIRKSKRGLAALDESINSTDDTELKAKLQSKFDRSSATLKHQERRMQDFCKTNGLIVRNDRVRTTGFGKSVSQKAVYGSNRDFVKTMKKYGFENPPKSLDIFRKMEYTNNPEYMLMSAYISSVKSGYLSPLVGYDLYKATYEKVQTDIVGTVTSNGIKITGQSKHFLERFFGTISNPSDSKKKPRSGVNLEDIKDALYKGKARNIKCQKDAPSKRSQKFYTDKCEVAVNPDTGVLIQCNPGGK